MTDNLEQDTKFMLHALVSRHPEEAAALVDFGETCVKLGTRIGIKAMSDAIRTRMEDGK